MHCNRFISEILVPIVGFRQVCCCCSCCYIPRTSS